MNIVEDTPELQEAEAEVMQQEPKQVIVTEQLQGNGDTNFTLWQLFGELNQNRHTLILRMMKGQVNHFIKHNGYKYETLSKQLNALQHEYFVIENNRIKMEMVNSQDQPVMKSGKDFAEYKDRFDAIMATPCTIKFI